MQRTSHRAVSLLVVALLVAVSASMFGSAGVALAASNHAPDAPTGLSVGDQTQPLDVTGTPQFGWLPQDQDGNEIQTAYQIQVTRDSDGASIWDSGKVLSSAESYVPYAGPALADGTSYSWRVKTWDRGNLGSPWPAWAHFDTGITDAEWSGAQWVRRVTTGNDLKVDYTLALKQFTLSDPSSPVVRARVYIAEEGLWELHVNGQVIDTQYDYQAPGETYYNVEDITSQAQQAQLASGAAANQLSVGVKYAAWATTEAGPRMEGPVAAATTLSAATLVGASTITVASSTTAAFYAVGENIAVGTAGSATFEVATISAKSGTTLTFTNGLAFAHSSGEAVVSENGPSGLLVKVVVSHADGTQDTMVSDPSWQVTKDTSETTGTVTLRSGQNAGTYIERYDATQAITGWDTVGFTRGIAWVPATSMGTHPLVNPASCSNYLSGGSPCGFTHLTPMLSALSYRVVHPTSVKTLADGTVEADFGTAIYGVPVVSLNSGVSGNVVDLDGSYRLDHTTLAAAASAGDSNIQFASLTNFAVSVGDTITVDAPADGYGAGNPEVRTVTAVGTAVKGSTTLFAATSAGASNIKVASITGLAAADPITIDTGGNLENATIGTVGTAGKSTTLFAAASAGATNIKVASVSGLVAADPIIIDTGGNLETGTISTVGTQGRNTTLSTATISGATGIKVASNSGFAIGDTVLVDVAGNQETRTVATVPSNSSTPNVTFTAALTLAHSSGVVVQDLGTGITLTSALTLGHSSGVVVQDLGTGVTLTSPLALSHASGAAVVDGGTGITLNAPLTLAHANGVWVEGSRVGTQALDNQMTNLHFYYTEATGAQTTNFFVGEGYRYLQISNPGESLSPSQIWVVASAENAPVGTGVYAIGQGSPAPGREATFTSDNTTLNNVFQLMERSALYSGEKEFNDSPDRQDGAFLGDAVNESYATMASLDERTLTRETIYNFVYSQQRYWLNSTFSPTAAGSLWGSIQAVYPDGDGMRDIPDYTEMMPEWLMNYYQLTGDKATLAYAYQTLQNVGTFVTNSIPTTGINAGLVVSLAGGGNNSGAPNYTESLSGSYEHGILDWPSPMRYDTKWLGNVSNSAEEIINARAVGVYSYLAQAATVLGHASDAATYTTAMNNLITNMNSRFVDANGLYDDGVLASGATVASNTQHGQAFAIAYGVAPQSTYAQLATFIGAQGMKVGPMDLGQLEKALVDANRPDLLVALLTNPNQDGPAKILAENGTSMWEQWNPGCSTSSCSGTAVSQTSSESFSHGWGAVGIVGMLSGLAGIQVTGAGASTVTIAPPASGINSLQSSEWTERGPVSVNFSRGANGMTLDVVVPDNQVVTVSLPASSGEKYVATGAGAPSYVGLQNGRQIYTVGSGHTHFTPAQAPVVTNNAPAGGATVAYGNALSPTVTISASDPDSNGSVLTAAAVGLPAGLSLAVGTTSADGTLPGTKTWTVDGKVTAAPGTYPVTVTVTDELGLQGTTSFTLTVTPEPAVVTYTGDEIVFTAPGGSSASVQLRATVLDSSPSSAGDIRNATVTFKEGTTTLCGPLPVGLLGTALTAGSASCSTTLGVGGHFIDIYVNGYYTGTSRGLVEVAQPDGSFVTGGGQITPVTSGGTYAATSGSPLQFAFNVKYLKNQKNLQGQVNAIFVSNGKTYEITTNALQSLGIVLQTPAGSTCAGPPSLTCFGLANIASKATLTDITNPNNPIQLGGNQTLNVTLTDKGNPGSSDSIGITLWNGNTLLFSSEWTGSKTMEDTLSGGNLVVH